jgi:hypothetical protein
MKCNQVNRPLVADRRYMGTRVKMRRMDREQKNRAEHINIPPNRQVSGAGGEGQRQWYRKRQ